MITKNSQETIVKSLRSIKDFVDEVVIVDGFSSDKTVPMIKKTMKGHGNIKIFRKEFFNVGAQRKYGFDRISSSWILIIDSDEVVSKPLKKEILNLLEKPDILDGYRIPFRSFFLKMPLFYGGENYSKLALFKKNAVYILPSIVHEKFIMKKNKDCGFLKNKIYHYSYRSVIQTLVKFTDYALKMSKVKSENGEKSSFKKIFFYPAHMFYVRFIKEKGYRDGIFRLLLDLLFSYMEFLMYLSLLFRKK